MNSSAIKYVKLSRRIENTSLAVSNARVLCNVWCMCNCVCHTYVWQCVIQIFVISLAMACGSISLSDIFKFVIYTKHNSAVHRNWSHFHCFTLGRHDCHANICMRFCGLCTLGNGRQLKNSKKGNTMTTTTITAVKSFIFFFFFSFVLSCQCITHRQCQGKIDKIDKDNKQTTKNVEMCKMTKIGKRITQTIHAQQLPYHGMSTNKWRTW